MSVNDEQYPDHTASGAGEGNVIAFPLHRVRLTDDAESSPVSVEDLRARITEIESTPVVGSEVSPRRATESERTSGKDVSRAKNIALHQLSVQGRSEAEVRQRLRDREVADEAIEAEIAGLLAVGLIDDRALARDLVDQLRTRKKLGDQAIRQHLARRKITRDVIDEVLSDAPVDEEEVLIDLATARARALSHLEPEVALRRLTGFLQRRGYQGSRVFEVAKAALSAQG